MLRDRGDQLKYALSNALGRAVKVVRGLRVALPVGEREIVAEQAVGELRALPGDPWKLNEDLPRNWGVMTDLGAPTPEGWSNVSGQRKDK
jgi:hypothetical protein